MVMLNTTGHRARVAARQIASGTKKDPNTIIVTNTTKEDVTLYSFDNDSIHIAANAVEVPISKKFDWRLPPTIRVKAEQVVSTNDPIEHQSNLEEAIKRAKMRRGQSPDVLTQDAVEGKTKEIDPPKTTVDDGKPAALKTNSSERGTPVLRTSG